MNTLVGGITALPALLFLRDYSSFPNYLSFDLHFPDIIRIVYKLFPLNV